MRQFKVTERYTIRETISSQKYYNEISSRKVISPEEEYELTRRMVQGDEVARKKVIEANLRFVVSVAKSYIGIGVPVEDLISAGNYGLVEASHKFDPERGFKFISFAVWYIRKEMNKLLDDTSRIVRLPINRLKIIRFIARLTNSYITSENREPSIEEIMDALEEADMPIERSALISIMNANQFGTSLDAMTSDEGDGITLLDILENPDGKADGLTLLNSRKEIIAFGMRGLNYHERSLIAMKHGLDGGKEFSFKEMSEYFEVGPETLRQRYLKAMRKMKMTLRRAKLDKNNYYDEPTERRSDKH